MIINHFNLVHATLQLCFRVQRSGPRLQLDVVTEQQAHDCFGGMGHENPSFEVGLFGEIRQRGDVIDVEVGDEDEVDLARIVQGVEKGERIVPFSSRMGAAIEDDVASPILQQDAGTTHFLSTSEGHDAHGVVIAGNHDVGGHEVLEKE